jgi:hypothetical protein
MCNLWCGAHDHVQSVCAGAVAQCYISTVMHRDMTWQGTSILRGVSVLSVLACIGSESIGRDPCPTRGESLLEAATHLKKMQLVGAYWHTVCLHTAPCPRWPCTCVNLPITYAQSCQHPVWLGILCRHSASSAPVGCTWLVMRAPAIPKPNSLRRSVFACG